MVDSVLVRLTVILVSIIVVLFTWAAALLTGWCLWATAAALLLTALLSGVIYTAVKW